MKHSHAIPTLSRETFTRYSPPHLPRFPPDYPPSGGEHFTPMQKSPGKALLPGIIKVDLGIQIHVFDHAELIGSGFRTCNTNYNANNRGNVHFKV